MEDANPVCSFCRFVLESANGPTVPSKQRQRNCTQLDDHTSQRTNHSPRTLAVQSMSHSPPAALCIQRFKFASEEQLTEFSKGLIPANTTKSTKWALKIFDLWREAQNQSNQEDAIPNDILMTNDSALLNTHLSRFAVEARKVNGDNYPPSTIHHFCVGYCST